MTVNALNIFKNRGYFFQCTNEEALNKLLGNKKIHFIHFNLKKNSPPKMTFRIFGTHYPEVTQ